MIRTGVLPLGSKYEFVTVSILKFVKESLFASNSNRVPLISITSCGRIVPGGKRSLSQPTGRPSCARVVSVVGARVTNRTNTAVGTLVGGFGWIDTHARELASNPV